MDETALSVDVALSRTLVSIRDISEPDGGSRFPSVHSSLFAVCAIPLERVFALGNRTAFSFANDE